LPSKSIPQGIAALFEFDESASTEVNEQNMLDAMTEVKTGLITYATRDTMINEIEVHANDYIGMNDETIVTTNKNKQTVLHRLIEEIVTEEDELLTIFIGEDVTEQEA